MVRTVPAATINPYSISHEESEYDTQQYAPREHDYTAQEELGPYARPGGPYATPLSYRFDGTPDPTRVQRELPTDFRQSPTKPRAWWARVVGERRAREAIQSYTAPYREVTQDAGMSGQRFARRAGETPPAPIRVTAELSPATGGNVLRPFTGRTPHRFNGIHFSLADHKRYDNVIYGMAAPTRARSTYRLDLVPWGMNVVDKPQDQDYVPDEMRTSPEITVGRSRAMRL
jgi:hypothetical protein